MRFKRLSGIYSEDESKLMRKSHENPDVINLYKEFLDKPNGHKSHKLLHTHYIKRGKANEYIDEKYLMDEVNPMTKAGVRVSDTIKKSEPPKAPRRVHEEMESVRVMALEAEVERLKKELSDSMETVDILKEVMSDYAKKA